MPKIRVTKRFHFEMAHTLYEYDGLCRNIHGHSYNLEVTLIGEPRNEPGHPKDGMVLDFGDLKEIVKSEIVGRFRPCADGKQPGSATADGVAEKNNRKADCC